MTAESDLRRYRAEAHRLREEVAKASRIVATQRKKASDAESSARRSKSDLTIRSKRSEAERATKSANEAESKRAGLEKKLADVELKINKAQERYEKERSSQQARALQNIKRRSDQAASQFAGPRSVVVSGPVSAPIDQMKRGLGAASGAAPAADVFLSHASEDKDDIARPLKEALEARGVSVWFDEIQIKVGQSIRREIEKGIAQCRFGIVIVSPHFFAKQWTQAELDALFSKKMESGEDLVLPVWHHISKDEVSRQSPLLSGIHALNSALMTTEEMADVLAEAVGH